MSGISEVVYDCVGIDSPIFVCLCVPQTALVSRTRVIATENIFLHQLGYAGQLSIRSIYRMYGRTPHARVVSAAHALSILFIAWEHDRPARYEAMSSIFGQNKGTLQGRRMREKLSMSYSFWYTLLKASGRTPFPVAITSQATRPLCKMRSASIRTD